MNLKLTYLLLLLGGLFFTACDAEPDGDEGMEENETTVVEEPTMTKKYGFEPFGPHQPYPDASITNVTYRNGTFNFGVTNYELGIQTPDADQLMCANSAKGQHIHLILDNEPYIAKYESSFDQEVSDGEHHILAFLSRSYHESIKTAPAHRAMKVNVSGGNFTDPEPINEPMLFYSRPKGTYVGKDTEKVMLDFYPVRAQLGANFKVKVNINGEQEEMVNVWQPYAITGLPMGDNVIELTLLDGEGNKVDAPLNPVRRTFTLKEDPAESM